MPRNRSSVQHAGWLLAHDAVAANGSLYHFFINPALGWPRCHCNWERDFGPHYAHPDVATPDPDAPIAAPLHLRWHEKKQQWQASTRFFEPDRRYVYFGNFNTIAEADAAYRAAARLDAARHTEVWVNDEPGCRTIVGGRIMPPLAQDAA